jgi:hypothetical protein
MGTALSVRDEGRWRPSLRAMCGAWAARLFGAAPAPGRRSTRGWSRRSPRGPFVFRVDRGDLCPAGLAPGVVHLRVGADLARPVHGDGGGDVLEVVRLHRPCRRVGRRRWSRRRAVGSCARRRAGSASGSSVVCRFSSMFHVGRRGPCHSPNLRRWIPLIWFAHGLLCGKHVGDLSSTGNGERGRPR